MKIGYLLLGFFICLAACKEKKTAPEDVTIVEPIDKESNTVDTILPVMEFAFTTVKFPDVPEGEVVEKYFPYWNSGTAPLVITDVRTSCGCTSVDLHEEPLEPGKKDSLLIRFDTKGRPGYNSKAITIVANTRPSLHHIFLKGTVIQ